VSDVPAAWYEDPTGRHDHRYWDGARWTEHVADLGVAALEPYDGPPVPPRIEPEPAPEPEPTAVSPTVLTPEPEPEPTPEPERTAVRPTTLTPEPEPEPEPEPTAAWRAAPEEATAAAAPRTPAATGSRRLIILIALAALVAIVVVIVLLLVGGDSRDSTTSAGEALSAQLAGRLRSANGFKADDAKCVSDYMVDHLHTSRLKGVDLTGEQVPAAMQHDFAKALGDGVAKCNVTGPNLSAGGTGGGATSGLLPSGSTPALPTGPQDEATSKQLFISFYQLTLGLDPTQAQCLADQMFAKLDAGKTSLGNAQDQMPDALKACKIPASVLDKLSHS
jgi:hypothetical protein